MAPMPAVAQKDPESQRFLVHIPKFRIGAGKVLANASMPDFYGTSDIILGYALIIFY
jgi:hypothetical protein